jgi:hypothetical protein
MFSDQHCGLMRLDLSFPARFAVDNEATLDNEKGLSQDTYLNIYLHKLAHNVQPQMLVDNSWHLNGSHMLRHKIGGCSA